MHMISTRLLFFLCHIAVISSSILENMDYCCCCRSCDLHALCAVIVYISHQSNVQIFETIVCKKPALHSWWSVWLSNNQIAVRLIEAKCGQTVKSLTTMVAIVGCCCCCDQWRRQSTCPSGFYNRNHFNGEGKVIKGNEIINVYCNCCTDSFD